MTEWIKIFNLFFLNILFDVALYVCIFSCLLLPAFFKSSQFLAYELTGLSRGGQQVNNSATMFNKAVQLLVELASLQVIV